MLHRVLSAIAIMFLALAWPLVALLAFLIWLAMGLTRDDDTTFL